jgi:hypothetical protein
MEGDLSMKKAKDGTEGAPERPRAMSVDLPGVREAIVEFCSSKPVYNRAAVESIVRKVATEAALEAVKDVAKLVASAA